MKPQSYRLTDVAVSLPCYTVKHSAKNRTSKTGQLVDSIWPTVLCRHYDRDNIQTTNSPSVIIQKPSLI